MNNSSYDFSGWATKNNIKCSDGRVIRRDAFKDCDGMRVPLVYNHDHRNINAVIGHADLENREDGVYAYGYLNETQVGKDAKIMLKNGDITHLSIYANHLEHSGCDVVHGMIREVSLVLAGANPGAKIEYVMSHTDLLDDDLSEADIYTDESLVLNHSDIEDEKEPETEPEDKQEEDTKEEPAEEDAIEHSDDSKSDNKEDTKMASPKEIFDAMSEEQQEAVYAIVGAAVEEAVKGNSQEDEEVKHSVFTEDYENGYDDVLSHADTEAIFADVKRYGSLKESCLQHGITDIDVLFPDAKAIANEPSLISRDMEWVSKVLNSTHHTPFSRVKSLHANITADEARARGYVKGNKKVEEVIKALKRQTLPQTVYKLQKLDRDDILDITDFNVVAFLKAEMRVMLNEEIARAILIGDGRQDGPDKIEETNIRPIWKDDELYTINKTVEANENPSAQAKAVIKTAIKARKDYKGSGSPVFFTTEDMLTDMLLIEDGIGRDLYDSVDKLKTKLRVSDIITVPVMENQTRTVDGVEHAIAGIIVNLKDYNVGADQGGSVSMFDDFDIEYNKERYLIETRCSGALTVPYSAIAIDIVPAGNAAPADNNEVTEG